MCRTDGSFDRCMRIRTNQSNGVKKNITSRSGISEFGYADASWDYSVRPNLRSNAEHLNTVLSDVALCVAIHRCGLDLTQIMVPESPSLQSGDVKLIDFFKERCDWVADTEKETGELNVPYDPRNFDFNSDEQGNIPSFGRIITEIRGFDPNFEQDGK